MKKIFFLILIAFFLKTDVYAADLSVVCSQTSCTKSGIDPLFNQIQDGLWYPGKSLTKTINLKNSASLSKQIAISALRTSQPSNLENVLAVNIPGIFSGSIEDFYNQSKIYMGTFPPHASKDFEFKVTMDQSANNDYQNKETVFDLKLGFWEEAPVPSPTPTNSSGNATSIVTIINRVIQINTGGGTSTSTINNIILNIKNIFRFSL